MAASPEIVLNPLKCVMDKFESITPQLYSGQFEVRDTDSEFVIYNPNPYPVRILSISPNLEQNTMYGPVIDLLPMTEQKLFRKDVEKPDKKDPDKKIIIETPLKYIKRYNGPIKVIFWPQSDSVSCMSLSISSQ